MRKEQQEYVPFMARVVMGARFVNSSENPVDPDIVELHLGNSVYTSEVTRLGVGQYTYTMIADTPGIYRRVWVGKNDDNSFYAESKPKNYIVQASELNV